MQNLIRAVILAGAVAQAAVAFSIPILPSSASNGAVGAGYSVTFSCEDCGGALTWSYSGTLPSGLNFTSNTSTATLSGTPNTGGAYSFTVSFIGPEGENGSQNYTVNILQIMPSSLPNGSTSVFYAQTLSVAYGSGSYSWSSANLPSWLTLSSAGTLSGTPTTAGTYSFNVTASQLLAQVVPRQDAPPGSSVSAFYTITVIPGLRISSSVNLPNGVVDMNYSTTITASGGQPPYTFTLEQSTEVSNTLPAGLTLNGQGLLLGVPMMAGDYGFNIDVTDSAQDQISAFFQLIIAAPFSITTASPLPTGSLQVAYSQSLNATGGNPPYAFSITTGQLPPGITLQPSGGFTGTAVSMGTFSFTAQATDSSGYTASKQFQLSIAPAGPLLQVSPTQLSFTAAAGGSSPPSQTIAIVAPSNDPVNYAAQILPVGSTAPNWLTISQSGGPAPGSVVVNVTPGTLTAANYQATIQITVPNNSSQAPINVTVNLAVTSSSGTASAAPSALHFLASASAPSTQEQIITMSNLATPTLSVVGGSAWLSANLQGSTVLVAVNSQGLAAGSYHDIVRLSGSNGSTSSVDVPVSLFVQSAGPSMALSANGLRFESRQGAGSTMPESVNVLNLGDPGSTVNWTVNLLSGSNWLNVSPGNGTATASAPGKFTLTPSAGTANLPAGPQYALLSVSDPNSQNAPQYLTAVLDNEPSTSPALPDPQPAGLFFTPSIGAQTVYLYTSSAAAIGFGVSTSTVSGGSWLSATPANGTAMTGTPAPVSVSVNTMGLAAGIYYGNINIEMSGALRTVAVTLVVPPAVGSSMIHADATCSPAQLAMTQTGLAGNFSVPAGWPATLIVQLNDNCGNAVSGGSVIASFSSGDPPLSLRGDSVSNTYAATWQPITTSAETTVTLQATAGTLQATEQFTGAVNQNSAAPPSLAPNGTLNIFFNVATANATGYALAPGSVIQVYGSGFAPSLVAPPNVPLLNQISGAFMLIGSTQIPLFFVSGSVLAAQVPFELTPNQQYQAILSANGALTLPETLDVVPMQPGVLFSISDGTVIAQRADGSLVSASSPAHPNDALTLYLTGMGATNPPVASGVATPLQLVPASTQPTVALGGQTVNVAYAGLTPTGIGLYQINITVPSNAQPGNLPLVIMQNGVPANSTTLPVSN
ncbi:MAG TPA: putative Ig domain-containing protein [Bryobacteraceae bacterium]|nr:putative Ig domain-containing protein [Bryobacteraceae bacterium]